jgi:Xaa-Pro dipeptidase
MILTQSCGSYFCRECIQSYLENHGSHAKYINTSALERYWDVGGVRIEDDILVTEDGYENLTSAPKGEEMLSIIRKARGLNEVA